MKDKNGQELIGVISYMGKSRGEDNPMKVVTQYGTGFVWQVSSDEAEITLDGGGIFRTSNADALEIIE